MECLICHQIINPGEQVFWGSQMECNGFGHDACGYSVASDGLIGAIHLSCLESPTEAARTPNTATPEPVPEPIPEPVKEKSVVQRSDALALLDL